MNRTEENDTRFPGTRKPFTDIISIEEAREEPIHFDNPAFLTYCTRKYLATACQKDLRKSTSND
ncbi:MAG: hypothetical protein VB050_09390 [Geobacteraceae bacterium]|nr:hypothetical protein [Geobacteraceae bacterium]